MTRRAPRQVVLVLYPDITLLGLAGPLQVFSDARQGDPATPAYHITVTSLDGGVIESDTAVPVATQPIASLGRRSIHTLIVVGGNGAKAASRNKRLIEEVTRLAARSKRVCAVCSGAFVLAASGLLDGRRAVTHWEDCNDLAVTYEQLSVQVDPIFVRDGNVWTSAGVTAGIDLAIALVAEDLGTQQALKISRSLVTHPARWGGQRQFAPAASRPEFDRSGRFDNLHAWIANNLTQDLRIETLASQANMSARNFARVYSATVGQTPAKTVEAIRTDAARALLETTHLSVSTVAARCGFMNDERMRRAFMRTLNVSPTDYRKRFQIRAYDPATRSRAGTARASSRPDHRH